MRHKASPLANFLLAAAVLTAVGCGALPTTKSRETVTPSVDRNSTEASVISSYLDLCMKVARGTSAEQAEILTTTNNDYSAAPTPSRVLRYAMVVSTPGHPGYDPVVAQRLLREVLANPETLLPAERALAFLQLQQVDSQQMLQTDVRRLQSNAERSTNTQITQLTRRLNSESEENARLKKLLAEAQAKLDAIANIERSTTNGRPTQPEARKP